LDDSQELFDIINKFLAEKCGEFNAKQCDVCLDTWKFNSNFISDETKAMLDERKMSF